MNKPPHPGQLIKEALIETADDKHINAVHNFCGELGICEHCFKKIISGEFPVTSQLAIILEDNGYGTAIDWIQAQVRYDLWISRNN